MLKRGSFVTLLLTVLFSSDISSRTKVDDHVLRDDEAPVLVTESYVDEPRRYAALLSFSFVSVLAAVIMRDNKK